MHGLGPHLCAPEVADRAIATREDVERRDVRVLREMAKPCNRSHLAAVGADGSYTCCVGRVYAARRLTGMDVIKMTYAAG